MARVLLIMPALPQKLGAPYLGQQYVAASLLAQGHEVQCIDMAADRYRGSSDEVVSQARAFEPDLIGMTLFTLNTLRGYQLAQRLKGTAILAAGGPHPTVMPEEPLKHGFDISVRGEAEVSVCALAQYAEGSISIKDVPGIHYAGGSNASLPPNEALDELPLPSESYATFDLSQYALAEGYAPGGLVSSRGCPARCTFCANYVTGRAFRFRSAPNVIAEMVALRENHGVFHFPFWDDAFTAQRRRLNDLCDAIIAEPRLRGVTWSCITPGNMVQPFDLERMRKAGCVAINFGIESGDYNILKVIQKGQRPEKVKAAVHAAKAEGMTTIVNFMFGFPGEGVTELSNTLDLMHDLSSSTDFFNNRGVLVPFPGTQIYDRWRDEYDLEGWWLKPENIVDEPDPSTLNEIEIQRQLELDPALDLNFFRYEDKVRDLIARCVQYKAQHNQATVQRFQQAS